MFTFQSGLLDCILLVRAGMKLFDVVDYHDL